MLTHIDMVKTISYIDGIKGLHSNSIPADCFVNYEHEHLSNYHEITWFMPFCIDSPVCGESAAHWRITLQAISSAEVCCLINAFRITGGALMPE